MIEECKTISGENPGKNCALPFTWEGNTYNYCPEDPDDKTKTWCSTKVDSGGNHVIKQGEWGHCAPECNKNNPFISQEKGIFSFF